MERSCRECLASFLNLLQDRFLPPCLVLIFFPSQDNAEQKRRRLDSLALNSSAEKERKEDRAERGGLEEEDGGSSTPGRLIYLFVVLPMRAGAFNNQRSQSRPGRICFSARFRIRKVLSLFIRPSP